MTRDNASRRFDDGNRRILSKSDHGPSEIVPWHNTERLLIGMKDTRSKSFVEFFPQDVMQTPTMAVISIVAVQNILACFVSLLLL